MTIRLTGILMICIATLVSNAEAAESGISCGKLDPAWRSCDVDADCGLAKDVCGKARFGANKEHVAEVQKYYACIRPQESCSGSAVESGENPIVKCEAYGLKFPSGPAQVPPTKSCTRLSDIVGMAINNGDLLRIQSAVDEAHDIDMSLSHIHETPLSLAALNGRAEIVNWLIAKKAKVNFQTTNGYTALMFAGLSHSPDRPAVTALIRALLKAGADKKIKNSRGETAYDQAKLAKNEDAAQLLR